MTDGFNEMKNESDLKQFFNDDYIEHVKKIKHTIQLQLDQDLLHITQQMKALVNQVDSMRTMIEQIHANTLKEEIVK